MESKKSHLEQSMEIVWMLFKQDIRLNCVRVKNKVYFESLYHMVLPLVDEDKPKCYLCHDGFENIEQLREHQHSVHKDFFEDHEEEIKREPAPGDVTVF